MGKTAAHGSGPTRHARVRYRRSICIRDCLVAYVPSDNRGSAAVCHPGVVSRVGTPGGRRLSPRLTTRVRRYVAASVFTGAPELVDGKLQRADQATKFREVT